MATLLLWIHFGFRGSIRSRSRPRWFHERAGICDGNGSTLTSSALRLEAITSSDTGTAVTFVAVAGKTYSVLFSAGPNATVWDKLADVPARARPLS